MESLEEFLNREDIKRLRELPAGELLSKEFPRDPFRAIVYDRFALLSPADGFILYSKFVKPDEKIVEVKGVNYTLKELLRLENFNSEALVIGIYMCALDVHYNRMPCSGYLEYYPLPPIRGFNDSMRSIEDRLLNKLPPDFDEATYLVNNYRMLNIIRSPYWKTPIYIVQIADADVDKILQYNPSGTYYLQGDKFSFVTMGSQVDLVIPTNQEFDIESLVSDKITYHVEAGVDTLVRIHPKRIKAKSLPKTVNQTRYQIIKRECLWSKKKNLTF